MRVVLASSEVIAFNEGEWNVRGRARLTVATCCFGQTNGIPTTRDSVHLALVTTLHVRSLFGHSCSCERHPAFKFFFKTCLARAPYRLLKPFGAVFY